MTVKEYGQGNSINAQRCFINKKSWQNKKKVCFLLRLRSIVPAKYSEHQVEHKKRSDDDEWYEIGPCEIVANRVVRLHNQQSCIPNLPPKLSQITSHVLLITLNGNVSRYCTLPTTFFSKANKKCFRL